jgi:SAM-dependent methyltransferase
MIRVRHFRKGVRILHSYVTRRPLDPELARDLHVWGLRARIWQSNIMRKPLDVRLHHEFNLWAQYGIDEGMENPHRRITEQAIQRMNLNPDDRVLDLACGGGLASRFLAASLSVSGRVIGMDVSDGMARGARARGSQFNNLTYLCGSAQQIPCRENFFTKVLSVEAFYYFESQERALAELYRVMASGGRLFLLICLYTDHTDSLRTVNSVNVPVHVRSIAEYKAMLRSGGWVGIAAEEFVRKPEPGRKPDVHDRALLLSAQKPA